MSSSGMYNVYLPNGKLNLYSSLIQPIMFTWILFANIKHEICVYTQEYPATIQTIFISFIQVNLLGNAVKTIVKWIS